MAVDSLLHLNLRSVFSQKYANRAADRLRKAGKTTRKAKRTLFKKYSCEYHCNDFFFTSV